jgi:hypothetical protein
LKALLAKALSTKAHSPSCNIHTPLSLAANATGLHDTPLASSGNAGTPAKTAAEDGTAGKSVEQEQ